jgi:hypothetical protein
MKHFVLRLRNYFLGLLPNNPTDRPVFDIQEKIQKRVKTLTKSPLKTLVSRPVTAPIPMAKITIQTIQIPMVDPASVQKIIQESAQALPQNILHRRQPSIIRNPLSEKDIADISSILKAFHGNDVRDLF